MRNGGKERLLAFLSTVSQRTAFLPAKQARAGKIPFIDHYGL
jgi:hypothetical protein